MKLNNSTKNRKPYQTPAVVYEGKVATRAGSIPGATANDDLFN